MSYRCTTAMCAQRTPRPPRLPWFAPSLAPHQQLDAGIAARHQADRKNLKKSKRPFANYFRTEFQTSPSYSLPAMRTDGNISSYNVVKLMTDERRSWTPFWGRATGGVKTRRKRQDVLEPQAPQFGDDGLDRTIERLLELCFQWDRGDDILASSLVPPSLHAMTEHCLPFASCVGLFVSPTQEKQKEESAAVGGDGGSNSGSSGSGCWVELDGEKIPLSVFRGRGRRKGPLTPRGNLGFSGVDTVPALVLDATRGPLVSSPTETTLTLRWKATNREATSVSEILRLHQNVGRVPVMGLPSRSLLLLLKAHATAEIEDPAMSVALAIAAGEHYNDYTYTGCLEMLRCLRRIAYVRGLARLPEGPTLVPSLYQDIAQCQMFFTDYVFDAAPFLVDKVWSRLPEHMRRLVRKKLFLDMTDLLSLAMEIHGWRIPYNLPNPASSAVYASKYLFLRYTLLLDEPMMTEYAKYMSAAASFSLGSSRLKEGSKVNVDEMVSNMMLSSSSPSSSSSLPSSSTRTTSTTVEEEKRVEEEEEEAYRTPLIIWVCVSLIVRLIAEALGDVLRHVEASMRQHVQLAKEYEAAATQGESRLQRLKAETDLQLYLDRIALPRPRQRVYQSIGRRQPRRMRLRLIPLEAFPEIFRHTRLPFEAETRQAHISTARQCAAGHVESPLVAVLARSALAGKHIHRTCSALDWAAMILTQCTCIVRHVPTPAKRAQKLAESAQSSSSVITPLSSSSWYALNSEAVDGRFVLCEALVRSRVQSDIDCLFTHIPWQGLEEQLLTFAAEERRPAPTGDHVVKKVNNASNACFLDDLFTAPHSGGNGDGGVCADQSEVRERQVMLTASSSAERDVRNMLGSLQESVERFQVAVADFIDAQEEFFLMV